MIKADGDEELAKCRSVSVCGRFSQWSTACMACLPRRRSVSTVTETLMLPGAEMSTPRLTWFTSMEAPTEANILTSKRID